MIETHIHIQNNIEIISIHKFCEYQYAELQHHVWRRIKSQMQLHFSMLDSLSSNTVQLCSDNNNYSCKAECRMNEWDDKNGMVVSTKHLPKSKFKNKYIGTHSLIFLSLLLSLTKNTNEEALYICRAMYKPRDKYDFCIWKCNY